MGKNLAKLNYGQPKLSLFLIFPLRLPLFNFQDFSGQGLGGKGRPEDLFGHIQWIGYFYGNHQQTVFTLKLKG